MDDVSNQGRMIAEMYQDADVVLEDNKEVAKVKDVQDDIDESTQDEGRKAESQAEIYKIDLEHANKVLSIETITAASTTIIAAEAQVPAAILTAAPSRVIAAPSRRRKGVVIRDPQEESTTSTIIPAKTKSKDKGKGILNQRSVHGLAKVKGWKLLESCGVQIITFTSTQLILLVERKYPLTRFTLDQMLNAVRLEVEEESEVSSELLRFIRQQHQEGGQLE
nr:hypothetical protein [Tanacetum cinerariifolium]